MYIATIVLGLVERGELSLDEPIGVRSTMLPERLASARELTLRQLLSHTSGLSQTFTRDEDRHRSLTSADLLDRIPPPVCEPSSCWSYADGNYVLAQVVLEATTRQSLAEAVRRRALGALPPERNQAGERPHRQHRPATAVRPRARRVRPVEEPRRLFEQSLPLTATLVTTAADAARFADALFNGDVLSPASLAEMLDTSAMRDLPCPDRCPFEYGLGVFHYEVGGHELVGHDGTSGTVVVHDRRQDLTVAILTNGGDQDMGAFLETVLNAIDETNQ